MVDRHKSSTTITVRVPYELKKLIYTRARKKDVSPNDYVKHALIKYTEYKTPSMTSTSDK